jgi:hypothetical protein
MWMFAERYVFPIYSIVILLIAIGIVSLSDMTAKPFTRHWRPILRCGLAWAFLTGVAVNSHAVMLPQKSYWLGDTAPQPDWRAAYGLIREHFAASARQGGALNVISPYPVLHDLYLGPTNGTKYYVRISFLGHPGHVSWGPVHTTAKVVQSLEELVSIPGYLMMDDMALRMLGDKRIASYLRSTPPDAVIADRFNVLIWLTGGENMQLPASLETQNRERDGDSNNSGVPE